MRRRASRLSNFRAEKLSGLLEGSGKRFGFGRTARAAKECYLAGEVLKEIYPNRNRGFKVKKIQNGHLFIKTRSAAVSNILQADSDRLIELVNQKIGLGKVKRLSFVLK